MHLVCMDLNKKVIVKDNLGLEVEVTNRDILLQLIHERDSKIEAELKKLAKGK